MRERVTALLLPALLTACTVGPRYEKPDTPMAARFDQATAEAAAAAPSRLWSSFDSEELDRLIARAIEANTTIAQAAARLAETRALSGLSVYSWFPTVTASGGRERAQFSTDDPFAPPGGFTTDTYRAGFDATWEIDLFGGLRNEFRAIDRRTQADAARLGDAQLSIIAETAQTWFALIGARETLALRREQLVNLEDNVRILEARVKAGSSNALDLAQAEAQRRSVAASVPAAEAELVRQEQRLAVLTAWPIKTLRSNLSTAIEIPPLPQLVATGTPEEWMKRRPDIRAAERELAATYSDVGDEIAEYFPKINLIGSFGWTAGSRDDIGQPESERWSYGPSISWSFLDFGRVRQRVKAAEARGLSRNGADGARGNGERARGLPRREPGGGRAASRRRGRDRGCAPRAQALRRRRRRLSRRTGRRAPEARLRGPTRAVRDAARDGPRRALQGARRRPLKRAHEACRSTRRGEVLEAVTADRAAGPREDRRIEMLGELRRRVRAEARPQPG
jgi:multidrug efflux system outer membrane protein